MNIVLYILIGIFGFIQWVYFNNWLFSKTKLNNEKSTLVNKLNIIIGLLAVEATKQDRLVDEFKELLKKGDKE